MPIETNNLVIYKSERLTDTSDGGGKYSGQVVVDGQSNNLFPDISELDRTMGRVSMRKVFPGVTSQDADALMGATMFVSENPVDPNVSALLFSTKSWTDTRDSAQNRLENYLAKGAQIAGTPLDTLWQGMKAIQVAMFESEAESSVGDTIILVSNEGKSNAYEQYVRITSVETRIAYMVVDGKQVSYKIATYTLNDTLEIDFVGLSAKAWYGGSASTTILRDNIVADSGNYYASVDLINDALAGEFTVQAGDIFAQLIPSAQTETPLLDLNAVNQNIALVSGNDDLITAQYSTNISTNQSLYIGSSVMPSSLSMTVFGQTVIDSGGLLKTADNTQVGTIDYQTGHIVWTNAIGSGVATINIAFMPAATPMQPFNSHAVVVTANNQGSNWTGVLVPIPAPGALIISFMSQGKFYQLKDNGSGKLEAASGSIGTGTINYTTGTWLLTTGALPDVGTPILLQWASPISTFARADFQTDPAGIDFQTFHNGLIGVTVTWTLDGVERSATSNTAGQFTGDATGYVLYNTGKGRIIPNKLPHKNTVFRVSYEYGNPKNQSETVSFNADGNIEFTIGTGSAIKPTSVAMTVPCSVSSLGNIELHDVPINETKGNLINQNGAIQGEITYATGIVIMKPSLIYRRQALKYTPVVYSTTPGVA